MADRCVVVSCHVEQPLDDAVWGAFSRLQARRAGGIEVAALMRPPDPEAGESESLWTARARIAAARGAFGLHTHWGGAAQARPDGADEPAELVKNQLEWLDERGFQPRLFVGGGWYVDEPTAGVLAERGVADCTATAFRPEYLEPGARRLELSEPAVLRMGGHTLTELPTTHSLGMAASAALRRLPAYVHVYFHDTDLLDARRSRALSWALTVLGRRRRPARLDRLEAAGEIEFSSAASGL
jgi:hypothetical protein